VTGSFDRPARPPRNCDRREFLRYRLALDTFHKANRSEES
jgi:hypothetical protein